MFRTRDRVIIVLTALALFVTGSVWLYLQEPEAAQTVGEAVVPASAADWGLSFQTEGEAPIGNATAGRSGPVRGLLPGRYGGKGHLPDLRLRL